LVKAKKYCGLSAGKIPQFRFMLDQIATVNIKSYICDQKLSLHGNVLNGKRKRWDSGDFFNPFTHIDSFPLSLFHHQKDRNGLFMFFPVHNIQQNI